MSRDRAREAESKGDGPGRRAAGTHRGVTDGQLAPGGAPWEAPAEPASWTTSPWSSPSDPVWAPPPPPGPSRRGGVPWVVVLGCVVGAVLVIAVVLVATRSVSDSPKSQAQPSVTAPGGTLPTDSLPSNGSGALNPDQAVLRQLGVRPADVAAGYRAGLLVQGDQVVSTTTLDLCNGTFPSESRRAARRQMLVLAPDGGGVFSTEAVFYDEPAGTAQAFTELRGVAAKCPSAPVPSPSGGEAVATKFGPAPDRGWPQTPTVERLAYDFVTTRASGPSDHSIAVYLRRGRVLVGIYFAQPGQTVEIAGKTSLSDIVSVFASRLAKLPDSIVTGHEPPAAVPGAV
jgi:hypothetical protein